MQYQDLTPEEQQQINQWLDQLFRPAAGELARTLYHLDIAKIAYQAGVGASLAKLDGPALVPNTSGLSGAVSMSQAELLAALAGFDAALATYNTEAAREQYIKLAGGPNVIG